MSYTKTIIGLGTTTSTQKTTVFPIQYEENGIVKQWSYSIPSYKVENLEGKKLQQFLQKELNKDLEISI